MKTDKQLLRTRLKAARQHLTNKGIAAKSHAMATYVLETIEWSTVQTLHTYLPVQKQKEADTLVLLDALKRRHPSLAIATWPVPLREHSAVWLQPNKAGRAVPGIFDVILVPMLGFNDSGHRIGYGGGFYDRFLTAQPLAVTIGLCYQAGRCQDFTAEAHDIPLRYIVTEQGIAVRPPAA